MTRTELRSILNRYTPYLKDVKYSPDRILDIMADGLLQHVEQQELIRGDISVKLTSDYKIFKSITSNREVDSKHIKKLVESISKKNLLYIRPLLVNENMEVIDGQHRLEACMALRIAAPYMICPGLLKEDIHFLNSVQKNWTTMDFINYFTIEDKRGYREFSKLANSFPKVKVSILLKLVSSDRNTRIRDGIMNINKLDEAKKICEYLDFLNDVWKKKKEYDFVYSAAFATALQKCVRNPGFDVNRLRDKILKYPNLFQKYTSRNEYLKSINLLYNKDCVDDVMNLAPENSII